MGKMSVQHINFVLDFHFIMYIILHKLMGLLGLTIFHDFLSSSRRDSLVKSYYARQSPTIHLSAHLGCIFMWPVLCSISNRILIVQWHIQAREDSTKRIQEPANIFNHIQYMQHQGSLPILSTLSNSLHRHTPQHKAIFTPSFPITIRPPIFNLLPPSTHSVGNHPLFPCVQIKLNKTLWSTLLESSLSIPALLLTSSLQTQTIRVTSNTLFKHFIWRTFSFVFHSTSHTLQSAGVCAVQPRCYAGDTLDQRPSVHEHSFCQIRPKSSEH